MVEKEQKNSGRSKKHGESIDTRTSKYRDTFETITLYRETMLTHSWIKPTCEN
ncbi:hypothetical protein E2C01_030588 [Portunus trituberculatus]|uniref:Uncharacterized protein n=1 Tax=Portunus trituberculatus TaxID=210409 RepID=A0A5B7EUM1_PORTR|nr:hypothetical protein [Portunus trituberculatus]